MAELEAKLAQIDQAKEEAFQAYVKISDMLDRCVFCIHNCIICFVGVSKSF